MAERRFLAGDIGIQTGDDFHPLLSRGDRLPRKARATLRTDEDDQASIEFTILQRLGPAWSAAFRQARIDGLPPKPRGKVKIKLEIEVSVEGGLVARIRRPGRKDTTEIARGRAETATRAGLARAAKDPSGIGLQERGLVPPGQLGTSEAPLEHACEGCGHPISFRAISLVAPGSEGFTCEDCGSVLLVSALDNMAASFFRDVPGGRLGVAVSPAGVEPERIAAHGQALRRLADALRPCPCGGRFDSLAPARCPDCDTALVDYGNDPLFRARQTHLPLLEGRPIVKRDGPRLWTFEHLEPYDRDVELGSLERKGDRLVLAIRFRNRDGWLVIPIQYALALKGAGGEELPAFRPVETTRPGLDSPEAWQAAQDEADEAFAREIEADLGFRPLLGRIEPGAEVSGHAVFPVKGDFRGPKMLAVARTLELPLA